jgi:hypothetical protein
MIEASITDRAALARRTPTDLAMYLRAHRWSIREQRELAVTWVRSVDDDEFEVVQPLESTIRDYALRVRDILRVAAVVEGKSELDVLQDMSSISMDVHSVRVFPADAPSGTIGLEDGVNAYESVRNLVTAAAYSVSVTQPRAVQPARKPTEVLEFLREIRIGAPAEGSFVLSVYTPIPPRLTPDQAALFDGADARALEPAEPYQRLVSLRIFDAARAAHDAANAALIRADGLELFTRAIGAGISANFCEALVGLGGEAGHPFEVSLSLAVSRPLARATLEPVRFRRDHLLVLAEVAREMRARTPDEGVHIIGNVVRLHREGNESGEISIAGTIEGEDRLRRIWINLPETDYAVAMRAHEEMLLVSVRGDLVRQGTRHVLMNPTAFRPLPDREA